jgi:hypothetical protein
MDWRQWDIDALYWRQWVIEATAIGVKGSSTPSTNSLNDHARVDSRLAQQAVQQAVQPPPAKQRHSGSGSPFSLAIEPAGRS